MNLNFKHIVVLFLAFLVGCSEPFNYDIEDSNSVIVDGRVSTLQGDTYVKVYRVIYEGNERRLEGVSDLQVHLINNAGTILALHEIVGGRIGHYYPDSSNYAGIVGESYHIEIENSAIGFTMKSAAEEVLEPVPFSLLIEETVKKSLTDINTVSEQRAEGAVIQIEADKSYYSRFTFEHQYEHYWYKNTIRNVEVDSYELYHCSGSCEEPFEIMIGIEEYRQWQFSLSNCDRTNDPCPEYCCVQFDYYNTQFYVQQEAISQEAYRYWSNVKKLLKNDGLVFDTAPFQVEGNITCDNCDFAVTGMFSVVGVNSQSKLVVL